MFGSAREFGKAPIGGDLSDLASVELSGAGGDRLARRNGVESVGGSARREVVRPGLSRTAARRLAGVVADSTGCYGGPARQHRPLERLNVPSGAEYVVGGFSALRAHRPAPRATNEQRRKDAFGRMAATWLKRLPEHGEQG